jgi:protein ImuB
MNSGHDSPIVGAAIPGLTPPTERWACVDLPALPLQLLRRRLNPPPGTPLVVVDKDTAQGVVLWADAAARAHRILPGMRYAAALSLSGALQAGVVPENELEAAITDLTERLRRFTPEVEPAARGVSPATQDPGVFWLNAGGLARLHPSLTDWAESIRRALAAVDLWSRIVVGFTRFGTFALVRALGEHSDGGPAAHAPAVIELPAEQAERYSALRVPLRLLDLAPSFRDALDQLGVRDVAGLVGLPPKGLRKRFGADAERLYRLATGELWSPLRPEALPTRLRARLMLEPPDADAHRLLFLVKRLVHPLLSDLATQGCALRALDLFWTLERAEPRTETLKPATPTLDEVLLLDLVRLKLEGSPLPAAVTLLTVEAHGATATPEQLRMFAERPRRDLEAADRALARVRAEWGDDAVVRAELRDAWLPEAGFEWVPLTNLSAPRPSPATEEGAPTPAVRRILPRPRAIEPRGWIRVDGPYLVSGGWWGGATDRAYHYAETADGELLWVFYDRRRGRWYLQGTIE